MNKIEKPFGDCTLSYLEDNFGLRPMRSSNVLQDWLSCSVELNELEKRDLVFFRELLIDNSLHWNEQELALHFIGPLFSLVHFLSPDYKYNLFAERPIEALVPNINGDDVRLFGKPDGILASGHREPKTPYFSFQEYKKHKEPNGEPEGQCLAALLAGQYINPKAHQTMYGCVIAGQNWYFLVLVEKQYCISPAYSALTDEVFVIFQALKALKEIVKKLTAQ
jgi:hypothetical protein